MIIWRIQPIANDHPEDTALCKCSSIESSPLQMIIQRIWPLAYDHTEDLASCKWSSGGTGLLQMIIRHPRHPYHLSQDPDSILRTFLELFVLVLKKFQRERGDSELPSSKFVFFLFFLILLYFYSFLSIEFSKSPLKLPNLQYKFCFSDFTQIGPWYHGDPIWVKSLKQVFWVTLKLWNPSYAIPEIITVSKQFRSNFRSKMAEK